MALVDGEGEWQVVNGKRAFAWIALLVKKTGEPSRLKYGTTHQLFFTQVFY
jgi:hypothetical protein